VRILCIADEYPWPATHGYRIRLDNVVRALAQVGAVDLFCTVSERADLPAGETSAPTQNVRLFVHHRRPFGPGVRSFFSWLRSGWPRSVAWIDWEGANAALTAWAHPQYDVVWFSHCHTWLPLGRRERGPVIVDLDNLEDEKLRTLMRLWRLQRREGLTSLTLRRRLRRWLGDALDRVDVRRWERAQLRAAEAAHTVVVCSDLDRERLGHPASVVVPNGYELAPTTPEAAQRPVPVLTMVGLLIYPPNLDAARFFAHRVLPHIRRQLPSARLRLVGRNDGAIEELAALPGVEILGEVIELDDVFASTAAVVVPLRAGSGTRVKILEAFARRIPVVSTSLGCEGLHVRDGIELLVGDTPEELAAACVRILSDSDLAASLTAAGHRLWHLHYRWDDVRDRIGKLAVEVSSR